MRKQNKDNVMRTYETMLIRDKGIGRDLKRDPNYTILGKISQECTKSIAPVRIP